MNRLSFRLPEFTRLSWVSRNAQLEWEGKFCDLVGYWCDALALSVIRGILPAVILRIPLSFLTRRLDRWEAAGLAIAPFELCVRRPLLASFSTQLDRSASLQAGVVLGGSRTVINLKHTLASRNQELAGRLLGYPECCIRFNQQNRVEQGIVDPTWQMACCVVSSEARKVTLKSVPETNVLWRWIGVRAIPHLPCSFECIRSIDLARAILDVGGHEGCLEEMTSLLKVVLSWPIEWSCLHGIAEIKTPVMKICTNSEPTAEKYIVQLKGAGVPHEAGQGMHFPFVVQNRNDRLSLRYPT